jgi:hypothetical protein
VRILFAILAVWLLTACRSAVDLRAESERQYEAGHVSEAIAILEESDKRDYVVAHWLAFLYMREAYYAGMPDGFDRASRVMSDMEMPESHPPVIQQYADIIRFNALGNAGKTREADAIMKAYCPHSLAPLPRRVCLRQVLADVMFGLAESPGGKVRRAYDEFLEISQGAYMRTYGWDPRRRIRGVDDQV